MGRFDPNVVITRPFVGICHMQVCARKGTPDEEILAYANDNNHPGVSNGWAAVVRKPSDCLRPEDFETQGPVQCSNDPDREHLLLVC